jgi:hypothetical protein
MPPVGFKPTISAGERPQTYALDRAVTATGSGTPNRLNYSVISHYGCEGICVCVHTYIQFTNVAAGRMLDTPSL